MSFSRAMYNAKGIMQAIVPRAITQKSLESRIQKILDSLDLEALKWRINFYHQIHTPFRLEPLYNAGYPEQKIQRLGTFTPHCDKLKNNKPFQKGVSSVYYYDSYEWTRYFNDEFLWCYEFGDVNYYLDAPSITKTRPIDSQVKSHINPKAESSKELKIDSQIESKLDSKLDSAYAQSNQNSILFKLEKYRHFCFLKDNIDFDDKQDVLFFRGAAYQNHRVDFLQKYFNDSLCDLGHTGNPSVHKQWLKPKISIKEHLKYKFLLSLEGNDVASNLKWILSSNSACVMPMPKYESWFMESKLVPDYHFICIADDYSNLKEKLAFYIANPNKAKEIIHNAHQFCAQFMDKQVEDALSLLVLRKYFYLSGQQEITQEEKALFGI
ncbi:glycosyl transferase family 90 [Helicobacter fennelliae]|uniref:Lipopolysaccharide core biosynthesis protein LpsA n=2 Tax=Helicobacter fennelliae TaxID=215 RepID=T1CYW8_9HELI|nr:glycosyl transferase family 90 [Helicobacter fennelliae]GAD19140.1 lipopolysaccharide core biosynthesis protein LpsA [Helicobacter fennelliae MRY12-0050]SQB98937.1 lipopolysaccharide core biosynthesis protein [Helicobacter fennelliae]STP08218.1 lipopolysaccharide core biosynthesis protein [Helicobacter fennelliae]